MWAEGSGDDDFRDPTGERHSGTPQSPAVVCPLVSGPGGAPVRDGDRDLETRDLELVPLDLILEQSSYWEKPRLSSVSHGLVKEEEEEGGGREEEECSELGVVREQKEEESWEGW